MFFQLSQILHFGIRCMSSSEKARALEERKFLEVTGISKNQCTLTHRVLPKHKTILSFLSHFVVRKFTTTSSNGQVTNDSHTSACCTMSGSCSQSIVAAQSPKMERPVARFTTVWRLKRPEGVKRINQNKHTKYLAQEERLWSVLQYACRTQALKYALKHAANTWIIGAMK